uniref:Uncharacterized protein n=1 Tax=Arsenophonus nasoniae TaxID=638 RepID=D2U3X6_9GAMM|nr:hypothetical protein ARN_33790 [Arsenophonus nasoniae]
MQKKLKDIHYIFDKILPAKLIKNIYPKFTPYVNRHYHYREVFTLITKCLKSPSPKLLERDLLFGIKNLAIIYELTILMSLHDIFINDFNVKIKSKEYRQYLAELPFGGKKVKHLMVSLIIFFLIIMTIFTLIFIMNQRYFHLKNLINLEI